MKQKVGGKGSNNHFIVLVVILSRMNHETVAIFKKCSLTHIQTLGSTQTKCQVPEQPIY